MTHAELGRVAAEAAALIAADADPVSIAIHVEEACGVVLPDALIARAHLGTTEAIVRTVASLPEAR
jgi:hypothetical protein